MSGSQKQQFFWVTLTIFIAIAVLASLGSLLQISQGRAASGTALLASLGALLSLGIAALVRAFRMPESTADRRETSSDLSAHLLTIQEEERKNLSRELHDGVGQMVTALKMELARLRVNDREDAERLDRARELANEMLRTIRNISLLLRPTALDDLGLEAALQWHAEDFTRRTSVRCELSCSLTDDQSIPDAVKTCVYRIVQEALNNCEKHAAASKVIIEVHQSPEGIAVSVTDDGRGVSPDSAHGLGILGMRERAGILGGQLEFTSEAGAGTRVSLFLPHCLRDGFPVS